MMTHTRFRLEATADSPLGHTAGSDVERPSLSYGQQRIWFLNQLEPNSAAYTIPMAYRIRGDVDIISMRRAIDAVVQRHETLRTRYAVVEGRPYQVIESELPGLAFEDLSTLDDPDTSAAEKLAREALSSFDLSAGPLFRARLLRLRHFDHVLVITVHHSVFDAWSLGVLTRELSTAYADLRVGRKPTLDPLELQYAGFAAWQRQHLTVDRLDQHLTYWRGVLHGAPPLLQLPTDHRRPEPPSHRGAEVRFWIPSDTVQQLRLLGRARAASIFMLTLAAFQALLSRYVEVPDVVVGVPMAGRTRRDLEGLIGFFVNTLPLRVDLSADPTFADLVETVRGTVLDCAEHQELPFEQMVEHLAPTRHLGRNPIAQVLFNLLIADSEAESTSLSLVDLDVREHDTGAATTRFDLELHILDHGDRLAGRVIYAADIFDGTRMAWFASHYQNLISAVAHDPALRISQIPIITTEEQDRIKSWNDQSSVDESELE